MSEKPHLVRLELMPNSPPAPENPDPDEDVEAETGPKRDRLTEHLVSTHPIATFAERLCLAVDEVPAGRETYVLRDGLRGTMVFGWLPDAGDSGFKRHQVVSLSRMVFWSLSMVPSAIVGHPAAAHLFRPLVTAMPDLELLVTRLTAFMVDSPGKANPSGCTAALEAELRARRS